MFIIAEECAGLGTGTIMMRRTAQQLCPDATIKCKYASEKDAELKSFLGAKGLFAHVCSHAGKGAGPKADKFLGKDGHVNIYIAGCECQPFSTIGKNEGKTDHRSKTIRAAIHFIIRRRPQVFILEQVANIKSKTHKTFLKEHILKKLKAIKSSTDKRLYKIKAQVLRTRRMPQFIRSLAPFAFLRQQRNIRFCLCLRSSCKNIPDLQSLTYQPNGATLFFQSDC